MVIGFPFHILGTMAYQQVPVLHPNLLIIYVLCLRMKHSKSRKMPCKMHGYSIIVIDPAALVHVLFLMVITGSISQIDSIIASVTDFTHLTHTISQEELDILGKFNYMAFFRRHRISITRCQCQCHCIVVDMFIQRRCR